MWLYISNIYTRPRIIQARDINKALHFCIFYLNTDFSVYGVFSKAIWLSVWMLGSRIQKDILEIRDGWGIVKVGNGSSRGGDGEAVMIKVGIMVVVAATIPAWQKWIFIISLSDSSLFTTRISFSTTTHNPTMKASALQCILWFSFNKPLGLYDHNL